MLGLIRKDMLLMDTMLESIVTIIVISLGLAWFGVDSLNFLTIYMIFVIGANLFRLDEKTDWESFAVTLPISRQKIVLSRYLSFIPIIMVAFIVGVGGRYLLSNDHNLLTSIYDALGVIIFSLLYLSLYLPLVFKYGFTKGGFMVGVSLFLGIIASLVIAILLTAIFSSLDQRYHLQALKDVIPYLGITLSLIVYFASSKVAGNFYEKRDV